MGHRYGNSLRPPLPRPHHSGCCPASSVAEATLGSAEGVTGLTWLAFAFTDLPQGRRGAQRVTPPTASNGEPRLREVKDSPEDTQLTCGDGGPRALLRRLLSHDRVLSGWGPAPPTRGQVRVGRGSPRQLASRISLATPPTPSCAFLALGWGKGVMAHWADMREALRAGSFPTGPCLGPEGPPDDWLI